MRLRSSTGPEPPTLNRWSAGSNPAGATLEGLPSCGIPSRKRAGLRALGVRLPLLPFRCGRAARRTTVNREAQVRILPPELGHPPRRRPVSVEARLADIEQGLVRFQGLRPSCPRGRAVMTPGSQPGRRGFDSRRGYCTTHLPVGERGHPAGFGSRRPLVRLQPGRLRGRGVAVLASLMSSRPWVRIPPALCRGT